MAHSAQRHVCGQEPERQLLGALYGFRVFDGLPHLFDVGGVGVDDVPKVAEHGHVPNLSAIDQLFPRRLVVAVRGKLGFPRYRGGQLVLEQALPHFGLLIRARGRVAQAEQVAHLHGLAFSLVLGEGILVEVDKNLVNALANAVRDGAAEGVQVERHQLGSVIAAQADALDRLLDVGFARNLVRKVAGQDVRNRAHIELAAGEYRQLGHERRVGLDDAPDGFSHLSTVVTVELLLVKKARQDLRDQLGLISHGIRNVPVCVGCLDGGRRVEFAHGNSSYQYRLRG